MKNIYKPIKKFFKDLAKEEGFAIWAIITTFCLTMLLMLRFV
jgi:hypothetical protein